MLAFFPNLKWGSKKGKQSLVGVGRASDLCEYKASLGFRERDVQKEKEIVRQIETERHRDRRQRQTQTEKDRD